MTQCPKYITFALGLLKSENIRQQVSYAYRRAKKLAAPNAGGRYEGNQAKDEMVL